MPPKRAPKRGGGWYWLGAALGVALIGWLLWQLAPHARPRPAKPVARSPDQPQHEPAFPRSEPPQLPATNPPPLATEPPPPEKTFKARAVQNLFEAQVALARQGISPGSIDGVPGSQSRAALSAFQLREQLPITGELDAATRSRLLLGDAALAEYVLSTNDLARLLPLGRTWLAKSEQARLDFENLLELVAEKSQTHPGLLRRLNPGVDWTNLLAGARVQAPLVPAIENPPKATFVRIQLAARRLEAFDANQRLLAHFPCSIAQRVDKRPVGELHVATMARSPNYTFNPEVFPESSEARELGRKLVLQPGPNNPVGTVWIGLDLPGYGIHGTPRPEDVGRTESHGCFRLANWNAELLARMVWLGMPVHVDP